MDFTRNPCFKLSVLFICFSLHNHLSFGGNTISAVQTLSGDQTLTSDGGNFELGFYQPGNTSNYYISMWYKKVTTQTIVWVANRETPISDMYSSVLTISNGNLVLFNELQTPVWFTNLNATTSNSVVAVLLDDGNLVLRDGNDSTQPILWQSFDNPVHTFLPGSKIAYNKRTNTSQSLTSWKNIEDPAPGLFSLNLDANNLQYLMLWNGSEQYWTSGPWNGQIFSSVPEMRSNYIFNFSYVDNQNESYFTYSLYNPTIISRCILDVSGQIKQLTWLESTNQWNLFWAQPRQQCDVYAFCGAFGSCSEFVLPFCSCLIGFDPKYINGWNLGDYSGGCVRKTELRCGYGSAANGPGDGFLKYRGVRFPGHSQSVAVGSAIECESTCLSNCSCTAYAYESNECSIWIGELFNLQQLTGNDGSGSTLYLRLAASELTFLENNNRNDKRIIIGAVVGSVAVVVLVGIVSIVILKPHRRLGRTTKVIDGSSLVSFCYKDLQNATKNFTEKLGGGEFGYIFKGVLPDSTVIAVKKLKSISQNQKQFRTEVSMLGAIQHVNLVRLRGFCSEGNKKFLVYDYTHNGSLDSHLFHEKKLKVLEWKIRYQIALGTARGLAYLHERFKDSIKHYGIKPENILLDADFCPKVSDFGLAKLVGPEFNSILTTMRRTTGYLSPEWLSGVAITTKADVYSYGMMLFELISGRRNSVKSEDGKVKFFPAWAARVVADGGDMLGLLDNRLDRNADSVELKRICRTACWCIQDDENHRPTMRLVVQILEDILDVNPPPIPQSLRDDAWSTSSSMSSNF